MRLSIAVPALFCLALRAYGAARPILMLQVDEMDARLLDPSSPLYHLVDLPNLRRLASEGVNFVNAMCESPLCVPSRTTMWTGRFTHQVRAWSNVAGMSVEVEDQTKPDQGCTCLPGFNESRCIARGAAQNINGTIAQALASSTAGSLSVKMLGKMDIGGGMGGGFRCDGEKTLDPADSEHGLRRPIATDTMSPDTHRTLDGRPEEEAAADPALPRQCSEKGGPSCYYPGCAYHSWARAANVSKAVFRPPLEWIDYNSPKPAEWDQATVDKCVEYLNAQPRKEGGGGGRDTDPEPFFLYCSINAPHPPMWTNATWLRQVAPREVVDQVLPRRPAVSDLHPYDWYQSFSEGVAQANVSRADFVMYVRTYLGRVAMADAMMGSVMDALEETWAADSALRLFVADHGELKLQKDLCEKMSPYDASVRVPFVVSAPRDTTGANLGSSGSSAAAPPRNSTDMLPVSLLDIFPTLFDFAAGRQGAAHGAYEGLAGQSLAGYLGLSPPSEGEREETGSVEQAMESPWLEEAGNSPAETLAAWSAGVRKGVQGRAVDPGARAYPDCLSDGVPAAEQRGLLPLRCSAMRQLGLQPPYDARTGLRTFVTSQFHGEESNTGAFVVRQADWKLILYGPALGFEDYPEQLFNMTADPTESNNVAGSNPAVVAHLTALLESQYDWKAADLAAKEEQRENFVAWAEAKGSGNGTAGTGWQGVLEQCYDGLDQEDFARFEGWMQGSGKGW